MGSWDHKNWPSVLVPNKCFKVRNFPSASDWHCFLASSRSDLADLYASFAFRIFCSRVFCIDGESTIVNLNLLKRKNRFRCEIFRTSWVLVLYGSPFGSNYTLRQRHLCHQTCITKKNYLQLEFPDSRPELTVAGHIEERKDHQRQEYQTETENLRE